VKPRRPQAKSKDLLLLQIIHNSEEEPSEKLRCGAMIKKSRGEEEEPGIDAVVWQPKQRQRGIPIPALRVSTHVPDWFCPSLVNPQRDFYTQNPCARSSTVLTGAAAGR